MQAAALRDEADEQQRCIVDQAHAPRSNRVHMRMEESPVALSSDRSAAPDMSEQMNRTVQRPRSSGGRRPRSARARLPPNVAEDHSNLIEPTDENDEVRAAVGASAVIHTPAPPWAAAPGHTTSLSTAAPPGPPVLTSMSPAPPLVPAAPRPNGRGRSGPRAARLQAALVPPTSMSRVLVSSSPRSSADDLFAQDTIATARPRSTGSRSFGGSNGIDSTAALFNHNPVDTPEQTEIPVHDGKNDQSQSIMVADLSPVTPQGASQQGTPWNSSSSDFLSSSHPPARPRSSGGAAILAGDEYEETLDQIDNLLDDLDAGVLPEEEDLEVIDDVLKLTRERRLSQKALAASGVDQEQANEASNVSKTKKDKKDKKKKRKKKKKEKQQGDSSRKGTSVNAIGATVKDSRSHGDNWEEEGALHVAAAKGDAYMLNMIIGDRLVAGQTPQEAMDGPDGNDWTALHYAVQHGETKGVQALLDAGCSINVADGTGWTPLMEAAWNGHADALALILRKLAPEIFRPISRGTSISPATALLSSPQLQLQTIAVSSARASAAAMASVDAQDKDGWTALHAAAYASDSHCVALLLRAGAAAQVVDGSGQSPADVAQAQGAVKIAGVLRGELSNDVLEASCLLENRMNNSRAGSTGSTGGRSSKDGKFRSPSPGLSRRGNGYNRHGADVESGLLAGDAVVESSDSGSDDDILDPLGAISRTGRT